MDVTILTYEQLKLTRSWSMTDWLDLNIYQAPSTHPNNNKKVEL